MVLSVPDEKASLSRESEVVCSKEGAVCSHMYRREILLPRDEMVFLKKRTFLPVTALLAMLALSACGGAATNSADVNQALKTHEKHTAVATVDPCLSLTSTAKAMSPANATGTASEKATATAGEKETATEVGKTPTTASTSTAKAMDTATAEAEATGTAHSIATITSTAGALTATAQACATATPATGSKTGSTSSSSEVVSVKTASMMLNGKASTVLTNARGITLYYSKADTAHKSACTGTCDISWHPVLVGTHGPVSGAAHLPGTLTVVKTAHGDQLAYNGHPLYTYAKDSAAGQANGENVDNKWFVATADLAMQH